MTQPNATNENILTPFLDVAKRMEGRADNEITAVEIEMTEAEDKDIRAKMPLANPRKEGAARAKLICAMDDLTVKDWRALAALSETGVNPTPKMIEAGEFRYLEMMNPGVRDFASTPFGLALVEAIYLAMEKAR